MKFAFSLIALAAAFPALAEESRQLDAHEHGVGVLNIAIDRMTIAMEFEAPGADIVGFEYEAESATDHATIEAAIVKLGAPLDLFVMPKAAGCSVVEALAKLEGDDGHDEEHEDHGDHDGGEEDEAGHTEFHAEYILACDNIDAMNEITFAYFEAFPNAQEVEVQIILATGAQAFEVQRKTPVLELGR